MTTFISNDSTTSPQVATVVTRALSVRLVESGTQDRLIPLPHGKCTVGASDRCQIHLTDAAVRPLHCLIVREGDEVSVTRWAPGVLLNGQDFATTPFHVGDVLQIGDAQLVLVAESSLADAPPQQPQPSSADTAFASQTEPATPFSPQPITTELPAASESPSPVAPATNLAETSAPRVQVDAADVDRSVERLQAANDHVRSRCRKLVNTLRTLREEAKSNSERVGDLQEQLNAAVEEREQIRTELAQLQADVDIRTTQSTDEADRLISELTAAYEKATTAETALAEHKTEAEQLQTELSELRGQREQWEQLRSSGELQRTKLAQALAEREQSIETLQAELEKLREAASQADSITAEQTATIESLQTELQQAIDQRDRAAAAQTSSRKYQEELEQALADGEQNMAVFQLELEKFQITSRQTEQEMIESKTALDALQVEFDQLTAERDKLVAKRTEYQLSEQGWEHDLAQRDDQIQTLSGEIKQLRAELTEAQEGTAAQESETQSVLQQIETLTAERDQLINAQAEQVEQVRQWEEAVETRDRRIRELEEEHDGICQVLQSVEKGAFEQVDECNKLQEQLAALREERDQLANALPDQRDYITQLEQTLAERDGQVTLLSDELTKTTERQTELETELARGTNDYQALQAEVSELNTRCEQLSAAQGTAEASKTSVEQSLNESRDQLQQLQLQIEKVEAERDALQSRVDQGSQSQESVQSEFAELQTRYEQLQADHQAELDRRQDLDQQLAERDQNIELFEVDIKSVRSELDRSVEQVTQLRSERDTLDQQLHGLREELAAKDYAGEVEGADLKLERDELTTELAAVRQELELAQQVAISTEGSSDSDEQIAQLAEEKSQLEQNLREQQEKADQLAEELERARECLQTAEQALVERAAAAPNEEPSVVAGEAAEWQVGEASDEWNTEHSADDQQADSVETEATTLTDEETNEPSAAADVDEESPETVDPTNFDESAPVSWDVSTEEEEIDEQPSAEAEQVQQSAAEQFAAGVFDDEATAEAAEEDDSVELDDSPSAAQAVATPVEDLADSEIDLPTEQDPVEPAASVFDKPETEPEQPKEEFQPTSFIDQYQHLLEDDGLSSAEPVQPAIAQPAEPAPVTNPLGAELDAIEAGHEDDSDEALQAYMSNMLRRMRGDDNDSDSAAPQASAGVVLNQNPNPVEAVSSVVENVAAETEVVDPLDDSPIDLESLKASSEKPALTADLSELRALANNSARRAIATHHKRRHLEKALGLFFVCLVTIGVGGFMLWSGMAAQDYLGAKFLGGAAAVFVGLLGGLKLLGLLLQAIREGAWEKQHAKNSASRSAGAASAVGSEG